MLPTNATTPPLPEFQITADCKTRLIQFFNGDTIDQARIELDQLRDTLITESYSDLDRGDKWLLIDFVRRIGNLIETAHVIQSNHL